jgi:NAD(P)-dependent dehydrogenase (short-subunit alcohol dehydrogenase family)
MSRRILVTGAASGIGAALVARLAAAGDTVIGLDRAGAGIICDLADPAAIAAAAKGIAAPLDGIAHVAGLPGTADPHAIMAVNCEAPRLLTEALAASLVPGASIVAVASVTAARCPLDDAAKDEWLALSPAARPTLADGKLAYECSKALLIRWVQHAAAAFRPQGIRVNTVSPGPVETPILADFEASIGADRIAAAAALTGRHAAPDEIAAVIAFLLGSDAGWINGSDIKVDGGYHALRSVGGGAG